MMSTTAVAGRGGGGGGGGRGSSSSNAPNDDRNHSNTSRHRQSKQRRRHGPQRQRRRQQQNSITQAWLHAIEQAVAIVSSSSSSSSSFSSRRRTRRQQYQPGGGNQYEEENNQHNDQVEASLRYLQQLETILLAEQEKNQRESNNQQDVVGFGVLQQQPPKRPPPPFVVAATTSTLPSNVNGSTSNGIGSGGGGGGVEFSSNAAPYWTAPTTTTTPLPPGASPVSQGMWMSPNPLHCNNNMSVNGSYPNGNLPNNNANVFRNSFAAFGDDDEEDDDEEEEEEYDEIAQEQQSSNDQQQQSHPANSDDEAAGDTPVYHNSMEESSPSSASSVMSTDRLLVRVWTSQADIASLLSRIDRSGRNYESAVQYCTLAVSKIQPSLVLADHAVSQWWNSTTSTHQYDHNGTTNTTTVLEPYGNGSQRSATTTATSQVSSSAMVLYEALVDDANAISISLNHLIKERDDFVYWMQKEEHKLKRRLQPQWESRNDMKQRWGDERWRNNPTPKHDYAAIRREDEVALRHVQHAKAQLDQLQVDVLQSNCDNLKEKLACAGAGTTSFPFSNAGEVAWNDANRHRYNGIRPILQQQQRVSWYDYPDATEFGWTFTGSNEQSRVEFFEKMLPVDSNETNKDATESLVLLDWYYTTGTIKTSMNHPRQGRTQLFFGSGAQVTPDLYRQMLENPLYHTNVRYRHRQSGGSPGRSGRGRGGGRRDRGGRNS